MYTPVAIDLDRIGSNRVGVVLTFDLLAHTPNTTVFRVWSRDPSAKDVTFLLVHPGHVKTEMGEAGGREAPLSVQDGVKQSLQNVILRCGRQDSGRFFNYDGGELSF